MKTRKAVLFFKSHVAQYVRKDGTVVGAHEDKRTKAAQPKPTSPATGHGVEVIEGDMSTPGGYSVHGKRYVGDEHEGLVDEAKQMAYSTGTSVADALSKIIPKEHLGGSSS